MPPETEIQPLPSASFSSGTDAELRPRPLRRPVEPPKKHPVRTAVIVLLLLGLGAGAWYRIAQTRQAATEKQAAGGRSGGGMPVPVVPGTVKEKDVPIYLDGLGTIQALNTVTIRARVDGQIEKIAFQEGQEVKEGDLLAQIDPAPFKAALDQALAKQRQDEAQAGNAKRDLARNQELQKKEVIAAQALDFSNTQSVQYEAQVKNDQAAVDNARVQLGYASIVSPLTGRVGIRLVDQGNIVHANDATGIVVVTQLQPISLLFTLPEQNLPEIHRQQAAGEELKVLALDRDNKTVLGEGKLTVVDNQIDTTTGTVRIKAEFPNADNNLWPGPVLQCPAPGHYAQRRPRGTRLRHSARPRRLLRLRHRRGRRRDAAGESRADPGRRSAHRRGARKPAKVWWWMASTSSSPAHT